MTVEAIASVVVLLAFGVAVGLAVQSTLELRRMNRQAKELLTDIAETVEAREAEASANRAKVEEFLRANKCTLNTMHEAYRAKTQREATDHDA